MNFSQLFACLEEMEPFKDYPSNLRMSDKPQKQATAKATWKISVPIPVWIVSQCVQPSCDGEKNVLVLCVWKPTFSNPVTSTLILTEVIDKTFLPHFACPLNGGCAFSFSIFVSPCRLEMSNYSFRHNHDVFHFYKCDASAILPWW